MPLDGQVEDSGESASGSDLRSEMDGIVHLLIGTNSPSMTDPFKLKYQLIVLRVSDEQPNAGVYCQWEMVLALPT
jgi:hypothetical protein